MTFVGKILIVVNVLLTISVAAFAGGVYAYQTSWKTVANSAREEQTLSEQANANVENSMNAEKAIVDKELIAAKNEAREKRVEAKKNLDLYNSEQIATKRITLQRDLGSDELKLLNADVTLNLKLVEQQRKFLADLNKKIEVLTDQIAQLEDDKYGLLVERKQIDRRHLAVLVREAKYIQILSEEGIVRPLRDVVLAGTVPPRPADGLVLETLVNTRSRTTLVKISVGRDDGIIKGQQLIIYRLKGKGKYLGKIEIVSTTADMAVGMVISKAKNGKIQKGDNVSAKL